MVWYYGSMVGNQQGKSEGTSGWVSTGVAAEVLGVSSRSVRNYILDRSLVARKQTEGINEKYLVSLESVYDLRDRRKTQGKLARSRRAASRAEAASENTAEMVKETAVDMLRETLANLETHIAKNAELRVASAELRARLELSEGAESALREELEGERAWHLEAQERAERLTQERNWLEEERERAQEEARELRAELEAERSKGFWRRLFGG
jgi:chromosome segregation ATPase